VGVAFHSPCSGVVRVGGYLSLALVSLDDIVLYELVLSYQLAMYLIFVDWEKVAPGSIGRREKLRIQLHSPGFSLGMKARMN
jgi:hypothetical protein